MEQHVWKDPRVVAGTNLQLRSLDEARANRFVVGGWKLGLGAPAARNKFQIAGPVVGYLLEQNCVDPGSPLSISGLVNPMIEAEIAVYFRSEVHPDCLDEDLLRSIKAVGCAIEIVDVDAATDDLQTILSKNIYQRKVVLGPAASSWNALDIEQSPAAVWLNGKAVQNAPNSADLTGRVLDNIRHVVSYLSAFDRRLSAGEVLILGAVVPPMPLRGVRSARISVGGLAPFEIMLDG